MSTSDEELPPSKLGTKEHWDMVYERENRVFNDVGDEGEVWFGESSVSKMRKWASKNLSHSAEPIRVMECGSGNGTLLLSFLTSSLPAEPQAYHLTGIDYSEGAVSLGRNIEASRRESLEDELDEDEEVMNDCEVEWRVEDLLRHDFKGETWDLVLDKGTFDALCLSNEPIGEDEEKRLPSHVYPERISKLVKEGGFFLITSCNFTEDEIKRRYTKNNLGFQFHSSVPHPSFSFGGKTGTTVCTVAFKKMAIESTIFEEAVVGNGNRVAKAPNGTGTGADEGNGEGEDLYLCIDGGGTKTDVAIASASRGVIARVQGGTGNMAEVGLQSSYMTITKTVLEAISQLPDGYLSSRNIGLTNGDVGMKCPVRFADIWVGLSGCDTPLDQERMGALLSPFFSKPHVPILNDSHLLGGALLEHNCRWGVAVIAGTGSIVMTLEIDNSGQVVQTARRGGMGYLIGDEGSAYDLGKWAIKFAIDDYDSGLEVSGGLASLIRAHFGVTSTSEILAKVYELDPTLSPIDATNLRKLRISSLSKLVLKSYSLCPPDELSTRVVRASAQALSNTIHSLVSQTLHTSSKRLNEGMLIMGGGVIRQLEYQDVLLDELQKRNVIFGPNQVVVDVVGQGVMGLVNKALNNDKLR